jgi:branched-chain amino acid aminotransferase
VLVPAAEARISLFDHGLLYGDGLFETVAVWEGRLFRAEAHLRRLAESARLLELTLPWSGEELARALRETVEANRLREGAARLTVTRGEGPPVPDPACCGQPLFFVTVRASPPLPEDDWERGISICAAGRHPRLTVPGVKSLSYLPFQQARVEARRRGFADGLLMDGRRVVEAAASNVFVVRDGGLLTPDLESGCLPGIARATVLELAPAAGIPAREGELTLECLRSGDEAFLTGSVVRVLPVVRVEETLLGGGRPGPVTRRLREAYRALVESECPPSSASGS